MASALVSANAAFPSNVSQLSDGFKSTLDNYLQYQKGMALLNNRYQFLENLQTGSFGKVTCALDMNSNAKVAIKALKRSVNGVTTMFNHEIAIMKAIGYHPNVIQLIDHFDTKKYHVMVLEFADCGDLYDAIHNKTHLGLNLQNNHYAFVDFLKQLLETIQFVHSRGIYHRDIKPENILLMNDGTIKLCDWGLSTRSLKSTDYNVGTEKYMAPEALVKHGDADYYLSDKVDFYSIGVTLLFTLFNKCPFRKALDSDPNYSNFLKSKYFIYDFFHNINLTSFTGIVDMLMIERNIEGLNYLIENGLKNGFTVDQEHSIHFSNQQDNYLNSIMDSFNDEKIDVNSNDNDVFLFDDYEIGTLNNTESFITNKNHTTANAALITHNSSNNNNSNSNHNSKFNNDCNDFHQGSHSMIANDSYTNLNPISIPIISKNNNSLVSSVATNTYNSSLFDSNSHTVDHNSFINSFELSSNELWADQLNDIRFKFH